MTLDLYIEINVGHRKISTIKMRRPAQNDATSRRYSRAKSLKSETDARGVMRVCPYKADVSFV